MQRTAPSNSNWEKILPIYVNFFYYARKMGILPYQFNTETLVVSPVNSGFSYYLFIFNVIYLCFSIIKAALLFIFNLRSNFEFEAIKGGYFFQLIWIGGGILVLAMIQSYSYDKIGFSLAVSTCIRMEKEMIIGIQK